MSAREPISRPLPSPGASGRPISGRLGAALLPLLAAVLPHSAAAQTGAAAIPQRHIPPPVLVELRELESRFDSGLLQDCAPERCVSKGCVYRDHAVVDLPRSSSLPGIPQQEGPGAVPAQEYLTQAQCDFAHEKSVPARDVQALVRRLEQRLSKGWLKVTVGRQLLDPISPSLGVSQPTPEPTPRPAATPAPAPTPPTTWDGAVAVRELWVALLPHFSWMIALLLVTLATLSVIWALRRLGKESIEEKMMAAQLAAGALGPAADGGLPASTEAAPIQSAAERAAAEQKTPDEQDQAFVDEARALWNERISKAEMERDESVVVALLHQWLKAGEFALLAKAIHVFKDRLALTFSSDGDLAARKVEFAEYLRNLDNQPLPSDAEFFRTLNHHAISSSLLSQHDADLYRSIREDFGSAGVANLIEALSPRHAALLFAMVPVDIQHEVTRSLQPTFRSLLGTQLLLSNRVSNDERAHLFAALDAARMGRPLPAPPKQEASGIVDLGREFDAPGALSVLFTHLTDAERQALLDGALKRWNGSYPFWYYNILYPDMLLKLPREAQADLMLEVDVKALAGWLSVHDPRWQETLLGILTPALQRAARANMAFPTRAEQLRMARRGRAELVDAMKRVMALGRVSFAELVA